MAALSSSSRGAAAAGGRQNNSVLDRPIVLRPRLEVSLSAFAFLFSEIVQVGSLTAVLELRLPDAAPTRTGPCCRRTPQLTRVPRASHAAS